MAVFITYTPEGIQKTTYYPSKIPPLEITISNVGISSLDFEHLGTLRRAITELQVALQVLELSEKKIDVLLLDGSPVINKPLTSNQKIMNYYKTYLSILQELIFKARNKNIKLAWIVKDSKMRLMTKFLGRILPFIVDSIPELLEFDYRSIINNSHDMDLFYYLLDFQQRSMVFKLDFKISQEFIKKFDLYSFHLKTARFDIPLRVEIFQPIQEKNREMVKETNILAETILPLSQYYKNYGIPAPIVEADARAKIKETEVDTFFQLMRKRFPVPDLWLRRRERSPWKF